MSSIRIGIGSFLGNGNKSKEEKTGIKQSIVTSGAGRESNPHVVLLVESSLQQLEARRAEYVTLHPCDDPVNESRGSEVVPRKFRRRDLNLTSLDFESHTQLERFKTERESLLIVYRLARFRVKPKKNA